jgi:hypothetical protein
MNAIRYSHLMPYSSLTEENPDTKDEMTRHRFDLRVHALIMMITAILAGYCGVRILDIGDMTPSVALPGNILSNCAMMIFLAIGALCFLESFRFWKRASNVNAKSWNVNAAHR